MSTPDAKKAKKRSQGRKRAAAEFSFHAALRKYMPAGDSMSTYAKSVLNGMALMLATRLTMQAAELTAAGKKKTIDNSAVLEGAKMLMGGDLRHLVSKQAVDLANRYNSAASSSRKEPIKAKELVVGSVHMLYFRPGRVERLMRSLTPLRLKWSAPLLVAAVMQAVMHRVIADARTQMKHYNHEHKRKVKRLTSKFIGLGLEHDPELNAFMLRDRSTIRGAAFMKKSAKSKKIKVTSEVELKKVLLRAVQRIKGAAMKKKKKAKFTGAAELKKILKKPAKKTTKPATKKKAPTKSQTKSAASALKKDDIRVGTVGTYSIGGDYYGFVVHAVHNKGKELELKRTDGRPFHSITLRRSKRHGQVWMKKGEPLRNKRGNYSFGRAVDALDPGY